MTKVKRAEIKEAVKRYRKFHGHKPDKVSTVNIPLPKAVVYLGEGLAIEYRSDKILNGRRGSHAYRHSFKKGVKVYTDKAGKALFVVGGKFRVTDWMRG